jgi:hypothetical protein
MKFLLLSVGLVIASLSLVTAQSRVSLAPTYWFNYNPYSYRINATFNSSTLRTMASGHSLVSSVGLTARYHFTPRWDVSAGALYYQNTDRLKAPLGPTGESIPFTSKGWQVPVLANYRLNDNRLSPYFSAGATFTRSQTFTARPLTTDGVVGIGANYRINPNLAFLVQPTASYSFYKPASDAFYTFTKYRSYNLGVQTQLIWHF